MQRGGSVLSIRARPLVLYVGLMALLVCSLETGLRLGAASPDTRFTLPQFSLGYFWDTPLGWTGLVDGVPVNRDSVQFSSLAGLFHNDWATPVPPQDNVYVRFAGYALMGSVLAPLVGTYPSFVMINVAFWSAGALATYALAVRHTGSPLTGILAAVLVSTAPAFEALAGQALPYVVSYSCFVLGLLLFDRLRVFERATSATLAAGSGVVAGLSLLFYDVYMLPAFVLVYGLMRRMPLRNLALMLIAMAVPRVAWTGYWQLAHLPSYSHNEQHPAEALLAWIDTARMGIGPAMLKSYLALAAHGVLNIGAAFLFWPVALAAWELWQRRGSTEARWCVAVLVAGFAPALFMLSTWPHIPRWYEYGFPAVYILAAAAGERLGRRVHVRPAVSARGSTSSPRTEKRRAQIAVAVLIVLPAVVLANLDVLGYTKPMELVLFQPTHWSYLWSR